MIKFLKSKKIWFLLPVPFIVVVLVLVTGKSIRLVLLPVQAQALTLEEPVRDPAHRLFVAIEGGATPDEIIEMIEASPEWSIETRSIVGTPIVIAAFADERIDVVQALIQNYGLGYLSERELRDLELLVDADYGVSIHDWVLP